MRNEQPNENLEANVGYEVNLKKAMNDNSRSGFAGGCALALMAAPVGAVAGTYLGEGFGWVVGNVID